MEKKICRLKVNMYKMLRTKKGGKDICTLPKMKEQSREVSNVKGTESW